MPPRSQRVPIDRIDEELLLLLAEDGRRPLLDLAQHLGISHVAVRKRLHKMLRSGLLRIVPTVCTEKLGLRFVIVLAEVEAPSYLEELGERFRRCPRILFLSTLLGGYNFLAIMIAETEQVLESIATACCIRRLPGIRRTDAFVTAQILHPAYTPPVLHRPESQKPPCGLVDCEACSRYQAAQCPGCPATPAYRL